MTRPLVSVVIPTGGRRLLLRRALEYYARQTYEPRELIVVETEPVGYRECIDPAMLPAGTKFLHSYRVMGMARAAAATVCAGDFVINMDDDDWYSARYLETMVWVLESEKADVASIVGHPGYDPTKRLGWWCSWQGTAGGCIAARIAVFDNVTYRPVGRNEDGYFGQDAKDYGFRVVNAESAKVGCPYVHMRLVNHTPHTVTRAVGFEEAPAKAAREAMGADCAFYDELAELLNERERFNTMKATAEDAMARGWAGIGGRKRMR